MTVPSMTESGQHDQDNGGVDEVFLGVDTHKDLHVGAVISAVGVFLASAAFPTTAAGYRDLWAWTRTFGTPRRAGVECTGSYGAALS